MRIQNEGTGKSSWWVINPDAKPGKAPRRRATSMDTKAYEKKRGRAKKKVEQLRAQLEGSDGTPNSSLGGSANDLHLSDTFQLSPQDFRARTSSNASSIGGRLSPCLEPDLHDNQVPPMTSVSWTELNDYKTDGFSEVGQSLAESLAGMMVGDSLLSPTVDSLTGTPNSLQSQSSPNTSGNLGYNEGNGLLPAPPPYPTQQRPSPGQHSPQNALLNNSLSPIGGMGRNSSLNSAMMNTPSLNTSGTPPFMSPQHQMSGGDMMPGPESGIMYQQDQMGPFSPDPSMGGINSMGLNSDSAFQSNMGMQGSVPSSQQANMFSRQQQQQQQQRLMAQLNSSLLRKALTVPEEQVQRQLLQQQPQQQQMGMPTFTTLENMDFTSMDFKPEELQDLSCDVDQIINHELSFDGNLDFNFDGGPQQGSTGGDGQFNSTIQT